MPLPKPDTSEDVLKARKAMFATWLDECAMVQEAFVEGLLAVLPSLQDTDG